MSTRQELGRFLRAHRELLDPAEVGLAAGSRRRRTPGLRREEVAALSGVGLAWYTWLEQGRVETSRQVLDAVARALRLDGDAHRHVLALAGLRPSEAAPAPDDPTGLLAGLPAAAVLDRCFDVVAANAGFAGVGLPGGNLVLALTDPAWRARVPDWEPLARQVFRQFRAHADRAPDDPRVRGLLRRLTAERPDLAPWWGCREVREFRSAKATVDGLPRTFTLLRPGGDTDAGVLVLGAG
ncbi:MmyB family transcriptional regulator [Saccharothrix coeruleofusca]|uniref:Transcriptional regulator n=1 Tax=Saccharothrix coeruleofusca TaxID=33919 RepID=A0A918AKB9_9PSEU|nr:helix-turn-helix domain-containing protein [Saccharothrix coeruleofusca]GGP48173.1 transcriptional regulator [Saccharothrix coeruleofusca]